MQTHFKLTLKREICQVNTTKVYKMSHYSSKLERIFAMTIIRTISALCAASLAIGLFSSCAIRRSGDDAVDTSAEVENTQKAESGIVAGENESTSASAIAPSESESPTETSSETETPPETTPYAPAIVDGGKTVTGMAVKVIDGVTYVGGVLVANKTYALPESYYIGGLTDETYAAFAAMQYAAKQAGLTIFCKSGFRSYVDQRIIYNGYVARDGQALADTYSARPGHSEHQSGMALDINSTSSDFANTAEGKWLAENCWDFGFIIRYPADKVDITGYMYEPWHVRYVGKEIAAELKDSGLCLEEYLGITSEYAE